MKFFLFAVIAVLSSVSLVRASSTGPTVTSDGHGGYTFDYSLAPDFGSQFDTGDFYVIYDVPGIPLTAVSAPTGWAASEQLLGPDPSYGTPGADDPTIQNIVFTYTGLTPITSTTPISGFDIDSSSSAEAFNWFGVQYSNPSGNSISLEEAPTTPEPISFALASLGLVGVLVVRRLRRSV